MGREETGQTVPVVVGGPGEGFGAGGHPFDRDGSALLEGLNPPQCAAVEYRGPALLIVAGAGSGKTRVLTHRIAHLIARREAWPSQILAITFTNKAASEMRERVEELLGEAAEGMWISTFHSACVRILRREAENFGFAAGFTIYDSGDSRALLKRLIKEAEADTHGFTPANTAARISRLKNELSDADAFAREANLSDPREAVFLQLYRRYDEELRAANAFDFDDLIGQVVYLFRAFPAVAAKYRRRFRHILVDEYQDTNHAQYSLIRELTRPVSAEEVAAADFDTPLRHADADGGIPAASLTVVGDSDQSIYAFRGADIRNIVEFERDFPGSEVILLEQNYRSTQNILSAANAVISHNFDRQDKRLWTGIGDGDKIVGYTGYTGHDEAQFIADEIRRLHESGLAFRDIAVFYRTNAQTRALEDVFIRQALPYRVLGGTKFYERAEIKDALAYLVVVANPLDTLALRRILNTPKRGIGDATQAQLEHFAEDNGLSFREALRQADALGFGPKVTAAIRGFSALLDEVAESARADAPGGPEPVSALLTRLLEGSGYLDALRRSRDPQDEARAENVEELVAVTKEFARENPEGTLVDFLTDVALVAAVDELDDASGTVSLMTLHTAKGLEFDTVFVAGVEEDLLPHRMSAGEPGGPAEERRLFYVGLTRARRRLFLSLAMSRTQYGDTTVAMPSRYLQEIPGELIDWRQSPSTVTSRGGTRPRALNARRPRSSSGFGFSAPSAKPSTAWPNALTTTVRDNGDLELAAGDRIRHDDFGVGSVTEVTGVGAKRVAHVRFDEAGAKKLLIKIAPIERL